MKKKNRKGFTIVELVIVIAVIGILAAVLIPTFSSVITDANNKAALQNARNIYTEYLVFADGQPNKGEDYVDDDGTVYIMTEVSGTDYYFSVKDGKFTSMTAEAANGKVFIKSVGTEVSAETVSE